MSSSVRDSWQRLVEAVMKREQYLELAHKPYSRSPSVSTIASDYSEYILNLESLTTATPSPHQVPLTKRSPLAQGIASEHLDNEEFIRKFYIPSYILVQDSEVEFWPSRPVCPVLVFINSRSGGQRGGDLLVTYRAILNEKQVIDLGEEAPESVLKRVFLNLDRLKNKGDEIASEVEKNLRIIVAGGDGTAGWLLAVVSDLKLSQPPPIATIPLGTENNLPFAFGWGKKNPGTDFLSALLFLGQVQKAKEMKIDSWHFLMRMGAKEARDPVAPLELPHSLHAFHRVSSEDDLNQEGFDTFRGGFWNYFSMGMDAQVSYEFHSERKQNPEKFKNQLVNQTTYAKLVLSQGWFLPSHVNHASSIAQLCKIKIMRRHLEWLEVEIPPSITSVVCLNLPSFFGGLNPWGIPNSHKVRNRDITAPYVDDGILEIVGFRKSWHGLPLLPPNRRGYRIGQAHRIRFEFHKSAADHMYMRIDGEPWKQPLPVDDETIVVEISHLRQVKMLATHDCRSKSVCDPSSPVVYEADEEDSDNEDEEAIGEEWRKFGAADTFRIPDEIDLSHLSQSCNYILLQ